jgi:hypothetical protein
MILLLLAIAQPPQAPPLEHRVVILEMKAQQHDARLAALESKSVSKAASFPAPAAVATPQPSPVTQPITASEFSPTWHYPPNTVLVQDANGVLVPSQAATHISYPGGPMQAAPPPQFYAPPPMRGGPFRGFGRAFRGANCSGGS